MSKEAQEIFIIMTLVCITLLVATGMVTSCTLRETELKTPAVSSCIKAGGRWIKTELPDGGARYVCTAA
jgi:hypothetical protein